MDTNVAQPTRVIRLTLHSFISLAKFSMSLVRLLSVFFLLSAENHKFQYRSWAVVIGTPMALVSHWLFGLVHVYQSLHFLSDATLTSFEPSQIHCQEYSNAKIKSVIFDLATDNTKTGLHQLREKIEGLDVGVLINNTDVADEYGMMSDKIEIETWMNIIKEKIRSLKKVMQAVLPRCWRRGGKHWVGIHVVFALVFPVCSLY